MHSVTCAASVGGKSSFIHFFNSSTSFTTTGFFSNRTFSFATIPSNNSRHVWFSLQLAAKQCAMRRTADNTTVGEHNRHTLSLTRPHNNNLTSSWLQALAFARCEVMIRRLVTIN